MTERVTHALFWRNGLNTPAATLRPRGGVSVVIPAKNEAANLAWVLDRLPLYVEEVILVDGSSVDDTVAVARSVRPDTVVVPEGRTGKGAALQTGFEAATRDLVVMLDADGSMVPSEMGRYLMLLEEGYDLVKGSRFMTGGGSADITFTRYFGNRGLLMLVNAMYGTAFTDLCYGFVAFHREFVQVLDLDADGFEVETQIVLRAARAGLRIAEVPSIELPRANGCSNLHAFQDGRRVLRTVLTERRWRPGPHRLFPTPPAASAAHPSTPPLLEPADTGPRTVNGRGHGALVTIGDRAGGSGPR